MVGLPSLSGDSNFFERVYLCHWFRGCVGDYCIMIADGLFGWQTCQMCGVLTACLYTEILVGISATCMDSRNGSDSLASRFSVPGKYLAEI